MMTIKCWKIRWCKSYCGNTIELVTKSDTPNITIQVNTIYPSASLDHHCLVHLLPHIGKTSKLRTIKHKEMGGGLIALATSLTQNFSKKKKSTLLELLFQTVLSTPTPVSNKFNTYMRFLGQIWSQNFSSLISTWNNMIWLKLLVCKSFNYLMKISKVHAIFI